MPIYVGTSGWQYKDWRERFYPSGLPQRDWLRFYAGEFHAVEVNNAFYRLPEKAIFARWRDQTPEGFIIAIKGSRYLTHIKRLQDPAEPVARLCERIAGLGKKAGPILLQLPPNLTATPELLDECLACFPKEFRVAVEPRHDSWWTAEVRAVLNSHNAALCWADRHGRPVTPLWRTAAWSYLRLHGGLAEPHPRYGRAALRNWVERISDTWRSRDDVFVYFNNDAGGAAVRDAKAFRKIARDNSPALEVPD